MVSKANHGLKRQLGKRSLPPHHHHRHQLTGLGESRDRLDDVEFGAEARDDPVRLVGRWATVGQPAMG